MMRSHGTRQPREVWQFGEADGMFYDAIKKFIELRHRLIPYNYSLAWQATSQAYTPLRLPAFDFPGDARALAVTDQLMSGPALMVCPVLQPMYCEKGSTLLDGVSKAREAYLPQDSKWFNFWTGTCYTGGRTVIADAPIEKLPLFVWGGSILPLSPVMQYVDKQTGRAL